MKWYSLRVLVFILSFLLGLGFYKIAGLTTQAYPDPGNTPIPLEVVNLQEDHIPPADAAPYHIPDKYYGDFMAAGNYPKGRLKAKSGEQWLTIARACDYSCLEYEKIEIKHERQNAPDYPDVHYDNLWNPYEGRGPRCDEEHVKYPGEFLFKGFQNLTPGPVEAAGVPEDEYPRDTRLRANERPRKRLLDGKAYELVAVNTKSGIYRGVDGSVVLRETGGSSQTLISMQATDFYRQLAVPYIVWAGDLDQDKRLDLILEFTDYKNRSLMALYLSSYARPGELVRPVANFRSDEYPRHLPVNSGHGAMEMDWPDDWDEQTKPYCNKYIDVIRD